MKLLPILYLFTACIAIGCGPQNSEQITAESTTEVVSVNVKYAKGFSIEKGSTYKIITVAQPFKGATKGYRYLLVPKGISAPADIEVDVVIQTPVTNLVTTSTSHLPALDLMGIADRLIGFPNTDLISSRNIRTLVDQGAVLDIGLENQINLETLIEASPELIMDFAMGNTYDQFEALRGTGIPVVLNADYLEETPLGRAEWIKFTAAFFDKEAIADSVFSQIEENYLAQKQKVQNLPSRPSVYTGIVYGDIWYQPGGNSYAAQFFKDAAGDYLWSQNQESGSLSLNFEEVYAEANSADYWIGVGSFNTLAEIEAQDPRYQKFNAFKNGKVYNYNARIGAKGGNEYLELGYARPDIVLSDLLYILHPELSADHQLYFYKKLN